MVDNNVLANSLRGLCLDMVEAAQSGHPGAPLGMADFATVLWRQFLIHNPNNPKWLKRDRVVLSNGHASALLYGLLHLTGYRLTLDDLKSFRQLDSRTPGHPEYDLTPGVEATTGPLGQGIANAVGMAVAEAVLAATFNRLNYNVIDNYTYVFVGDGCLMEGVSHESCSLAGTLGLHKLIMFWDNNGISIDGEVKEWFSENVEQRFLAYGWQVINIDGHDYVKIAAAITQAKLETKRPTLINCKTIIGFGSKNLAGTCKIHGEPVGPAEVKLIKENLGLQNIAFVIDSAVYTAFNAQNTGAQLEAEWTDLLARYAKAYPDLHRELMRRLASGMPDNFDKVINLYLDKINANPQNLASRKYSAFFIEYITQHLPELFGGSSDLSNSNGTITQYSHSIMQDNKAGNYLHYGVREFAMVGILNGMALFGGFIPFGGTFLAFSDYAKPAIRLGALMRLKTILVLTHDSIGLGEDGPTHQPIEQLATLRAIPNLVVWRPATEYEVVMSWKYALTSTCSTALVLSRQVIEMPRVMDNTIKVSVENISRGGYVVYETKNNNIDVIIIATGSELELALKAALMLASMNIRVVSMPSLNIFAKQDVAYQEQVLPQRVSKRLVIEAGINLGWDKYLGSKGLMLGINNFGASGKSNEVLAKFGFTVDNVCALIRGMV